MSSVAFSVRSDLLRSHIGFIHCSAMAATKKAAKAKAKRLAKAQAKASAQTKRKGKASSTVGVGSATLQEAPVAVLPPPPSCDPQEVEDSNHSDQDEEGGGEAPVRIGAQRLRKLRSWDTVTAVDQVVKRKLKHVEDLQLKTAIGCSSGQTPYEYIGDALRAIRMGA